MAVADMPPRMPGCVLSGGRGTARPQIETTQFGALEEVFGLPLMLARWVREQRQNQRGSKVYSLHAPEVECIGKGKSHRPYEIPWAVDGDPISARVGVLSHPFWS
jgi:hypothetical protein